LSVIRVSGASDAKGPGRAQVTHGNSMMIHAVADVTADGKTTKVAIYRVQGLSGVEQDIRL
jgi:hypothetical protein